MASAERTISGRTISPRPNWRWGCWRMRRASRRWRGWRRIRHSRWRWHGGRARFAALFADGADVAVPPAVLRRIEASLDGMGRDDGRRAPAANDNSGVGLWRGAAIAAGLAACLLLVVTVMLALRPAPEPVRVPVPVAAQGAVARCAGAERRQGRADRCGL